jgi:hypothetical protein
MTPSYIEKVAQFGPDRGHIGILTVPVQPVAEAPTIVLLNSGIIHRVGSNRIGVKLARAFGAAGFTTLRFDYSGIGDSQRRVDVPSLQESVGRDISVALQFCERMMDSRAFVLAGLCSGAYDALHNARDDARIVGVFMVDIPGPFKNGWHTFHHIKSRLLRPSSWGNPLRKSAHYLAELKQPRGGSGEQKYILGARSRASREWMDDHMCAVLSRGAYLSFIFTRGDGAVYNHESLFPNLFPDAARHRLVKYAYFPNADHAFSRARERSRLISHAVEWLDACWPTRERAESHRVQSVT